MKTTLALTLLSLLPALAHAESAGGLSWKAPPGWSADAPRPMRAATYKVPPAKGETEGAECAVFYFGSGQGGGVEDNLKRWLGQFEQPDGKPSEKAAKIKKEKIGGLQINTVELAGTYNASMGPMAATPSSKPGFRLLGAIVEGPQGNVFFKLTGPAKTVEAASKDFRKMLASLAP